MSEIIFVTPLVSEVVDVLIFAPTYFIITDELSTVELSISLINAPLSSLI